MMRHAIPLTLAVILAACGPYERQDARDQQTKTFSPVDPKSALFWGRFTAEVDEYLQQFVNEFNDQNEGLPVRAEFAGGYGEIYKKTLAGIHAGKLPSMAVAYESMTAEYVYAGAVNPIDDMVRDPDTGLTPEDMDDFFPAVIATNTFPQFDGRMYSFPFAKSVLMLYYNKRVLREAGIDGPPETWDDFLTQCRAIKEQTGKQAHAVHVDPSTFNGIIFSMGGEIVRENEALFDSPEAIAALELYETLFREDLAFQTQKGSYDDHVAFANDETAFILRTSASRTGLGELMGWDADHWGIAPIPQADPDDPHTVLFGPNIVIFNVDDAHERRCWEFIRFFTSRDGNVRWAIGTGYLPIRKSAAQDPRIQEFWNEWPDNRTAFDSLAVAKPEPNLIGWQEVRGVIDEAIGAVINGMASPQEAAQQLDNAADTVFQRAGSP